VLDCGGELGRRGDHVAGRIEPRTRCPPDEPPLERVVPVELQHGGGRERGRGHAVCEVLGLELWRGDGEVTVQPEQRRGAAWNGLGRRRDGGHRLAAAQTLDRDRLVCADHFEARTCLPGGAGEHGHEPGGERVGVHDERDEGSLSRPRPQLLREVSGDPRDLPRRTEQHRARLGRRDRPRPTEEHRADPLLERAHTLTDRRRRHVQALGCALETSLLHDRHEGRQVFDGKFHGIPF